MKRQRLLVLTSLILTASLVSQVEHAPTIAQCQADQRLWLAEIEDNPQKLPEMSVIVKWNGEMQDCEKVDPNNRIRYYNTSGEISSVDNPYATLFRPTRSVGSVHRRRHCGQTLTRYCGIRFSTAMGYHANPECEPDTVAQLKGREAKMSDISEKTWNYAWDYTEGGGFCHPMLPVSLIPKVPNGVTVSCDAVVDSGADYCLFPKSFLEQLGIDQNLLPHTEVFVVDHLIKIDLSMVTLDFGFTKYNTLAGFHECNFAMLGHKGFFDRFIVVFDTANKQFMITNQAIPTP
jgi:hypothetical protein